MTSKLNKTQQLYVDPFSYGMQFALGTHKNGSQNFLDQENFGEKNHPQNSPEKNTLINSSLPGIVENNKYISLDMTGSSYEINNIERSILQSSKDNYDIHMYELRREVSPSKHCGFIFENTNGRCYKYEIEKNNDSNGKILTTWESVDKNEYEKFIDYHGYTKIGNIYDNLGEIISETDKRQFIYGILFNNCRDSLFELCDVLIKRGNTNIDKTPIRRLKNRDVLVGAGLAIGIFWLFSS